MASSSSALPASLQEATRKSTLEWQANLKSLFQHAKDRFPDVVWELTAEDECEDKVAEEVWGHKAIVYARAPPSFQSRYFFFKQNPSSDRYPSSPVPGAASTPSFTDEDRVPSPVPSGVQPGGLLRIRTPIPPALFSNELEYLYTGQGFCEAFEFLSESFEGDTNELRIDKLRRDLVFMWRSRLYSDIRISLTGTFSSLPHETVATFSSHRFILVSRSPYFYNALVSWAKPKPQQANEPITLSLPSPPFTPASLHFTLGFLYTGTLIFSSTPYDLNTAFAILRSATYLSLDTLYDEIQARIIQEMMHGLFHTFLSFAEYERLTSSKWGTGGCRCRQCARRAPRVLEFAVAHDVRNPYLERGARRALISLFGEGWCTSEFAALPQKLRESLLKGVGKHMTVENVFPLLFAAEHALIKLNPVNDAWGDTVREMIESGRRALDEVLCNQAEACFMQLEWLEIMENDGARFEDGEKAEWIMEAILRGMNDKNCAILYQTLISSVLLRPSPTDPSQVMLSTTSNIRIQVEQTQADIVAQIRKRWLNIRQEGGFDDLDGWAIKEISYDINVPVDDLNMPVPKNSVLRSTRNGERDTANIRVSVLSRSLHSKRNTMPTRDRSSDVTSSSAPVYSARSTFATATNSVRQYTMVGNVKNTLNAISRTNLREVSNPDPRPDSKLTPVSDTSRLPTNNVPRVNMLSRSLHSRRNITPTRDRSSESSDVTSPSASMYSARSTFSTATNSVRRSTMADRPSINQWVAKLAEDHVPIHEPIEFLLEAKSETDVSRSLNKKMGNDIQLDQKNILAFICVPLLATLSELKALGDSPVNEITLRHARELLNLPDFSAIQIPSEQWSSSNAKLLLDFILSLFLEDRLTHLGIQDATQRARKLMLKLTLTDVMPESLFITGIETDFKPFAVGGYARISRGDYKGMQVALKMVEKGRKDGSLRQDFCREALVWRSLSHPFILPLLGIFEDGSQPYLVSPFMENKTLRQWRNKHTPPAADLHKMMLQVAEGVQYIHSEGIVHSDLHGDNVLLDSDFSCKITDFGSSRHFETVVSQSTRTLSIHFAAPELFGLCIMCGQYPCSGCDKGQKEEHTGKTKETDVYAYGCLYYEMFFNTIPFHDYSLAQIVQCIIRGQRPGQLQSPEMGPNTWNLIQKCWESIPSERPKMKEIVEVLTLQLGACL